MLRRHVSGLLFYSPRRKRFPFFCHRTTGEFPFFVIGLLRMPTEATRDFNLDAALTLFFPTRYFTD